MRGGSLLCWLHLPKSPPPWPVFMCDNTHYIQFAQGAHEREVFALCRYHATDPAYVDYQPDPSEPLADLLPCDWSEFRRRAWCASRALDWLLTLPQIRKDQIYIGGHSRSAKQSMIAAAFDTRFAGVLASSPGSGGSMPYRYCDESVFGESVERLTTHFPQWVSPKVRFFAGREHKLPADSHLIYALIAPRPVLMSTATTDCVEHTWAVEQTWKLIQPVYALLGKPQNLALRYREGLHDVDDQTREAFSQFLLDQSAAPGSPKPAERFPFKPLHPWDYEGWRSSRTIPAQPSAASDVRSRLAWLLGDGPAYQQRPAVWDEGESEEQAALLQRNWPVHPLRTKCRFGDGINGNIYFPGTRPPAARAASPRFCGWCRCTRAAVTRPLIVRVIFSTSGSPAPA
jgi:hypothetical protein